MCVFISTKYPLKIENKQASAQLLPAIISKPTAYMGNICLYLISGPHRDLLIPWAALHLEMSRLSLLTIFNC